MFVCLFNLCCLVVCFHVFVFFVVCGLLRARAPLRPVNSCRSNLFVLTVDFVQHLLFSNFAKVEIKFLSSAFPAVAFIMKAACLLLLGVAAYEKEWAEFQAVQGTCNGEIPQAFEDTVDAVREHDAKDSTYKLSFTGPLAHKTQEEYKKVVGYKSKSFYSDLPKVGSHVHSGKPALNSIDWGTKDAVTTVKNQGQGGPCWPFFSTGGIEGQWEIATGSFVSLSKQQLVDCSKQNNSCNGGLVNYAFAFYENTNIATESPYSDTACDGRCKSIFTTGLPKGGVTGYNTGIPCKLPPSAVWAPQLAVPKGCHMDGANVVSDAFASEVDFDYACDDCRADGDSHH